MVPLPLGLFLTEDTLMAARNFGNELKIAVPGLTALFLKGTGAGAADITLTYGMGMSPTLDQTGTGLYTLTLKDKYTALVHANLEVIDATTPDDWDVRVVSETVSTTKLINIAVFKGGTLADLSTDEKISGILVLLDSAAKPVKEA